MKQGIVIGSHPGGFPALGVLLRSLDECIWPIHLVINDVNGSEASDAAYKWLAHLGLRLDLRVHTSPDVGYELGAFRIVLDRSDLDEFLFFQDTFEVKDQGFINDVFADPRSVALGPTFFHYAGKWKRSVLEKMEIPVVRSKRESIHYEHTFSRQYWEIEDVWVFDPEFHDGVVSRYEERFGRQNMVLENQWYIKRKGNWGQIPV